MMRMNITAKKQTKLKKNSDKALSLLSLAAKAGRIASGEFAVEKAVKENKAFLIVVADDASENTKKSYKDMCEFYKVPVYIYATKERIGHSVGKEYRAAVAVCDKGFADGLVKYL